MESQDQQEGEEPREDIDPEKVHQEGIDEGVKPAAGASSTEERCPICLGDFEDKAFIDACFHTFCFSCVVRWAETTITSCPMCKTAFSKVIHNVRANDNYDVFKIVPKPASSSVGEEAIDLEAALRSFRGYRTTRLPGQPARSQPSTSSASVARPHPSRYGRGTRKRRRDSRKPASTQKRRAVYSAGVWALPPTRERTGAKPLKIRDISASFFCSNPAATHRLYPWLERELEVLVGVEHVQFVTQLITSLIDKVDLQSEEFPSYLEPYLHEKTGHFVHELISFASSPFDMIAYDQNVAYNWPAGYTENNEPRETGEGTQGSSADIQQRILDELTSTSWDDSPPILETTSPGYLDHSSDSDFAGEGSETGEATISHCQEELSNSRQIVTDPEEPASMQTTTRESTVESLNSASVVSSLEVQGQSSSSGPAKEEFEISLFAEEEGSGDDYKELVREKTPRQDSEELHSKRTRSLTNPDSTSSNRDHRYDKRDKDKRGNHSSVHRRNREDHNHKRKKSQREKERSRSRDRFSSRRSYRDKYLDSLSRRDSHSKSHRKSRHRHSHGRSPPATKDYFSHYSNSYDDRERESVSDNAYYWRDRNHRSKLYSDDLSESESKSPTHSRSRGEDGRSKTSDLVSTVRAVRGVAGDITQAKDSTSDSRQALHRELSVLDKEINENKRDLLKSMLRRERIEFLRKSLYPRDCADHMTTLAVETRQGDKEASVGDMQKELKSLEVAILDGKKHLLKVMKKIEEDQGEQDSD